MPDKHQVQKARELCIMNVPSDRIMQECGLTAGETYAVRCADGLTIDHLCAVLDYVSLFDAPTERDYANHLWHARAGEPVYVYVFPQHKIPDEVDVRKLLDIENRKYRIEYVFVSSGEEARDHRTQQMKNPFVRYAFTTRLFGTTELQWVKVLPRSNP